MSLPFHFEPVDEGCYEVSLFGVRLGAVYCDDAAWSYGRWFIESGRRDRTVGGVAGATEKPHGFRTRAAAAMELAVMQSGELTKGR